MRQAKISDVESLMFTQGRMHERDCDLKTNEPTLGFALV